MDGNPQQYMRKFKFLFDVICRNLLSYFGVPFVCPVKICMFSIIYQIVDQIAFLPSFLGRAHKRHTKGTRNAPNTNG